MGKIVGIDLGTTQSLIALCENDQTRIIVNSEGSRLTPSVVSFSSDGTRLVGRPAKSQAAINPTRTLSGIKRLIGRRRNELTDEEKMLPYKIIGESGDLAQIEVDGKRYYPSEISAMVLQDLKRSAEKALGESVTDCVITVPARFGDSQRQATKEAAEICGFRVLRVLNEPTAAALAYGLGGDKNERIIVADAGGGTVDFTCLDISSGVFQVLSTNGDLFLGGDDFDRQIVNFVADEFIKTSGTDVRKDPMALQRLNEACEKAKCDLSLMPQTSINIPYITAVDGIPKHLSQTITRALFEQLCEPLFQRFRAPISQCLSDAKLLPSQIQQVVLVGGSTRIPKIVEICREIFGREPHTGVNADEAIAIGAARQAAILGGDIHDIILIDVTPLSLGVETLGGVMTTLIPRNTAIPVTKTESFSTASDNQPAVDIHVLQGERKMAAGNRTLARMQLTGIPLQARGAPKIDVAFHINADGILSVAATDANTGKVQKIEVKSSSGLEQDDIKRMVSDAAAYEREDAAKAALIEIRNKADALVYHTEKFVRENSGISQPVKDVVSNGVASVKAVLDSNGDKNAIQTAIDALEGANKTMYDACFNQTASGPQKPPATPQRAPSNVGNIPAGSVDAEFHT